MIDIMKICKKDNNHVVKTTKIGNSFSICVTCCSGIKCDKTRHYSFSCETCKAHTNVVEREDKE